jgi:hypothetical protein
MAFNAITEDSTGRVVEWGATTLRAAGAGETAHIGTIDESSQSVIDTWGPNHTKVVAGDFTEMSAGEKAAVDVALATAAAEAAANGKLNYLHAITDVASLTSVAGALTIDCHLANEFRVLMDEDITSIVFGNVPVVGKAMTTRIVFVQDATPRTLPASWTGVDWWIPAAGAPVMPTGAGKALLAVVYHNGNETIGTSAAEPGA